MIEIAEELVHDGKALKRRLKNKLFREAAEAVGVSKEEILPRQPLDFRSTMATPRESLVKRVENYDHMRTQNIALILTHMRKTAKEKERRAELAKRIQAATAADLLNRVAAEKERAAKAEAARLRRQRVIEMENTAMRRARKDFDRRERKKEQQLRRLQDRKAAERKAMAEAARKEEEKRKVVRQRALEKEEKRLEGIRMEEQRKEEARERLIKQLRAERSSQVKKAAKKDAIREKRRLEATERIVRRREALKKDLEAKEKLREQLEVERRAEFQRRRDERWQAEARHKANAARLLREQEARRRSKLSATVMAKERQQISEHVLASIVKERQHRRKKTLIHENEWKSKTARERNMMPGPGEYPLKDEVNDHAGGKFGHHNPKSYLDEAAHRSRALPAPGQYAVRDDTTRPNTAKGAKFSTAKPKTFLEEAQHRSVTMPSPNDYRIRPHTSGGAAGGFKFSKHRVEGVFDEAARLNKDSPGPGGLAHVYERELPDSGNLTQSFMGSPMASKGGRSPNESWHGGQRPPGSPIARSTGSRTPGGGRTQSARPASPSLDNSNPSHLPNLNALTGQLAGMLDQVREDVEVDEDKLQHSLKRASMDPDEVARSQVNSRGGRKPGRKKKGRKRSKSVADKPAGDTVVTVVSPDGEKEGRGALALEPGQLGEPSSTSANGDVQLVGNAEVQVITHEPADEAEAADDEAEAAGDEAEAAGDEAEAAGDEAEAAGDEAEAAGDEAGGKPDPVATAEGGSNEQVPA